MNTLTNGQIFLYETLGTATLLLLGAGVVATAILRDSKGFGGGWLLINFGWGLAVFAGVFAAWKSGAHLNPAVTLGLLANGKAEYAPDVEVTAAATLVYLVAQLIGAFIGAVLAWAAYKQHFDEVADPGVKLGVFATGPAIRTYGWNLVTEIIATMALVLPILAFGLTKGLGESGTSILIVSFLVVGIGLSLGGPTGYAINPARDLGPRIAHALLPIPNKGTSDWSYAWIPVVGPLIGAALAGIVFNAAF